MECELVGVNLGDLLISVTLLDELTIGYSGLLTLSTTRTDRITTFRTITMFLQLLTTTGETGDEYTCDGPDVAQTKDLRDKTGDLVSDLKIPSD